MAKFSEEPITNDEIRELLLVDDSCKEIVAVFGIPWQRVAAIKGAFLKPRRDPNQKASLTSIHHRKSAQ
jgi:hypothetical protein